MVKVDGNVIARIESSILGMGKRMMYKICKVLGVGMYEFYINHDTPIFSTDLEKKALFITRDAEKMGVGYIADESCEYVAHRLETIKKGETQEGVRKGKAVRDKAGS